jgi:hypothetical protein
VAAAQAPVAAPAQRYRIRKAGRHRVLTCLEAPTVQVRIERGSTVTAAHARSHPPGTIFLDGAAQGEPFLDPERSVYNLDHHEGCIRSFTLATCEQAMVLLRKRLDLRKRDWTVHANDADLDTVLAIWVLLNHLRLADDDSRTRAEIMPLLRLEGSIDALGLEFQDLCALPPELMEKTRARMAALLRRERALKADGSWEHVDPLQYVAAQLHTIDRMVYPPAEISGTLEIEELARSELAGGSLTVVCRAKSGIYEVERELRRVHGERLGLVVLQKDPFTYSLRQVDPALPRSLERVYARLNLLDPGSDGSRSPNRWGGSEEIGGSPRSSGTRLSPRQIALACRRALAHPGIGVGITRIASATFVTALFLLSARTLAVPPSWLATRTPSSQSSRSDRPQASPRCSSRSQAQSCFSRADGHRASTGCAHRRASTGGGACRWQRRVRQQAVCGSPWRRAGSPAPSPTRWPGAHCSWGPQLPRSCSAASSTDGWRRPSASSSPVGPGRSRSPRWYRVLSTRCAPGSRCLHLWSSRTLWC